MVHVHMNFIFVVLVTVAIAQDNQRFIPILRKGDKAFPDFSERNIPTGFVDSPLVYYYNTLEAHPCDRLCAFKSEYICYYKLTLEEYESYNDRSCPMACLNNPLLACPGCIQTDGVKSRLLSINRQLPGPPLNVCLNDLVIIDIINNMTEPTSIHWHGFEQRKTPYMDGAPFITQMEIPQGKIYRYHFNADNHGTNFYHSHSYWQRGQGIYGTIIVRLPPRVNPIWFEYDLDLTEHTVVITDWGYNLQRNLSTLLINGKGVSQYTPDGRYYGAPNVYFVPASSRCRFRIIYNGMNNLPVEFSIDNHDLILIAADGTEIQPTPVSSIVLNSGERFDFVLIANQPPDNYWMKVSNPLNRTMFQVAILHYDNAARQNPIVPLDVSQKPLGVQVNTHGVASDIPNTISVADLRGLTSTSWMDQQKWDTTYIEVGINLTTLSFYIDRISNKLPDEPLLLQKDRIDESLFCNRKSLIGQGIDCLQTTCRCLHVIPFALDSYVELILFSVSVHPFHLHGYLFYVVGMGVIPKPITRDLIMDMDRKGELPRNTLYPILKDTVQIPRNGYVIIRFHANNPGYWFFHCHLELHAILGMSAVIQIGKPSQMKSPPPNFRPYYT